MIASSALPTAPTTHRIAAEPESGGVGQVVAPITKERKRVAALRNILKESTAKVVEGVRVDTFSASAFLQVFDKLTVANQAMLLALPITSAINACFRLFAKQSAKANA